MNLTAQQAAKMLREQRAKCGMAPLPERPAAAVPLRFPILIPVRVLSEANRRDSRVEATTRKKMQQSIVAKILVRWRAELQAMQPRPLTITLTALTPPGRRKMDDDNLARSLKVVRDQVAEILEIDDGDERAARWLREEGIDAVGTGGVLLTIREYIYPLV